LLAVRHIHHMALLIAEGVYPVEDAQSDLRRVPETLPGTVGEPRHNT